MDICKSCCPVLCFARFPEQDLAKYQRLSIPLKWIDGPDRITVRYAGRQQTSGGYFLSITPEDSTRPESFDSEWVGYEWRSFLNEVRSGRKIHGKLFTFAGNVTVDQLPFALRSFQMVPYSSASPHDSWALLSQFVVQTLNHVK